MKILDGQVLDRRLDRACSEFAGLAPDGCGRTDRPADWHSSNSVALLQEILKRDGGDPLVVYPHYPPVSTDYTAMFLLIDALSVNQLVETEITKHANGGDYEVIVFSFHAPRIEKCQIHQSAPMAVALAVAELAKGVAR